MHIHTYVLQEIKSIRRA